jgi:hypothetical protein
MFKRKTTTLTARTVQIALALSGTSTALASGGSVPWFPFGYTAQEAVDAIAAANTDYKTKSDTVSPDELEPSSAAAADAAADLQDTLALELGRYGETSLEIILIDDYGKANLFEMVFNVPDHNDKGSFIDFVIDQNFGQEDMAGFTDDVLLGGLGLDRPGESAKGVVIPSEGDGLFGGMGGIPELNTSVEFKRSWELRAVGPGAVVWQDPMEAGEPYAADTGGDGKPDSTMAPAPKPNEGTPMPEPEQVEPEEDDGKDDHHPDDEDTDDSDTNPAPDETGDQIMTQQDKDEFRASVTPDQSAARAAGASLLAIMFGNISNPVPEERGASSRGAGDLLGDCAGLPPWECEGDSLSVSAVGQSGIMITGLGTQNSQTSGQSMTGRGSGVPTGPDCDEPNPADCI